MKYQYKQTPPFPKKNTQSEGSAVVYINGMSWLINSL